MSKNDPSAADPLGQIADEFVEAFRQGKRPSVEEFARRYPKHAGEIRDMLPALVLMEKAKTADDDFGQRGQAKSSTAAPRLQQLGDYQILREVGRGGMGVVYEAQQLSLGRHVAIKVLPSHALLDPRHLRRFQREARSAARLHHTNIVPVFGVGEQDGLHYYVMQFIPGLGLDVVLDELKRLRRPHDKRTPTLDDVPGRPTHGTVDLSAVAVARRLLSGEFRQTELAGDLGVGPAEPAAGVDLEASSSVRGADTSGTIHLPGQTEGSTLSESGSQYWQSVARIGVQVADALVHAASQGVLHRDIKPSNLLLDETGNVWVTDFGLAKADTDGDNLTHTGDVVGTFRYMAPERFNGQGDLRSDVYSLGLTLYELLTLRPAFNEADRNKLVKRVMHDEPVRPRKLNRSVPRDLETVVLKAIARDPAHRYQTPSEMAEDLKRFVEDRPVKARRISGAERLWRWCHRNPALAGMAAVVVLTLAAGTTVSTLKYLDAEQQKGIAQQLQARAEAGEKEAKEQRNRADKEADATRQNLYYAQMHLAPQAWREHRGLAHLHDLLANWLPDGDSPDRRGWEWFYLNSLPYQNLRILMESREWPRAKATLMLPCTVEWHVASKRLAEGTVDGLIRIWDVDREQTTLILKGPTPVSRFWGVRWLRWSPDGAKLAAGGFDGTVHIWETASGRELHVLRGHQSPVWAVAFSSDGSRVAAWGPDGVIKLWDANTGRLTAAVAHPGDVFAGAWSPDDTLLASGHSDGTVTISGPQAGAKLVTLRGHAGSISNLAWGPDSTRLAVASRNDFAVGIWDVASEKMVLGPLRHSHEITSLAWEPDGQRLATGSADETAKIWNMTTGREAVTLRGHRERITSLAWGPGGRLASGCADGSLKIWNSVRDQESSVLPGNVARATSVSWSPSGKRLASGGDDGKVRIWDPATRQEVLTLKGHDEGRANQQFGLIRSLAWSPDGRQLASAGLDGRTLVWEVASGRKVFALPADRGFVWSVAWSPDGTHLAAGSQDGMIRVVEGIEHTPKVRVFKAHQGHVRSLAWSPQGDRLASGGEDRLVKLWDPIRGAELARMEGHQYWVMGLAWSPDGKRLASASGDRLVITWDAQTGRKVSTMRGHNDWVDAVVWSPDATRLASAGLDDAVRVWDTRTGDEAFALRGHSEMFHDVSWSPDGAQLAAAGSDGLIWIWDATCGFERDTTPRALPYIDRKVASGNARGEDLLWCAESYFRPGKPREGLVLVKDNPSALLNLYVRLTADEQKTFAESGPDVMADWLRAHAHEPDLAQAAFTLASARVQSGVNAFESRRLAEAIRDLQTASDLLRILLKGNPNDEQFLSKLSISVGFLGSAFRDSHRPVEALALFQEERSVLESMRQPSAMDLYNLACGYAQFSLLLEQAATPPTAAEREALFEQAMDTLRRSFAAGMKDFALLERDHDLDPLRERSDFRALLLESAGRTREAVPHLASVSAANPKDTLLVLKVAALQAWFGQEKELAATRQRILSFAKGTNDAATAQRTAMACSIRPSTDQAELEAALTLAGTGAKLGRSGSTLLALGMAEYRSSNYAAADRALLGAVQAGENTAWAAGIAGFYRAMSSLRQGKPDEARKLAIAAAARMKPLPKDENNPLAGDGDENDLILWLAYKEAKATIKFDAAPPPNAENARPSGS
jgi:WD40 repeat protein/serine/threonine protein kinase